VVTSCLQLHLTTPVKYPYLMNQFSALPPNANNTFEIQLIWDVGDWSTVKILAGHEGRVMAADISPNSKYPFIILSVYFF
jgi:hypothetical protein